MKGIWKDMEVKELFSAVEAAKSAGKAAREAFSSHAIKFGRKANSVRNYYYHEVDRLKKDSARAQRLGIDMNSHQKNQFEFFSEGEKEKIIEKIKEKLREGYSVRKACMLLSGGDIKQMLRLQNKYRSSECNSNVVNFRPRRTHKLTESEISGLFMGLVKLVKNSAAEEVKDRFEETLQHNASSMRTMMVDLGKKERELKFLREDYAELKKENALLKKKLLLATCCKASEMSKNKQEA